MAGGALVAGVPAAGATPPAPAAPAAPAGKAPRPAAETALDDALRRKVDHIVVIYCENRSFNNLFADFPGLQAPLAALKPEQWQQRDRDGRLLPGLPPVWGGLVPQAQQIQGQHRKIHQDDLPALPNAPFALSLPDGSPLPHAVVTRDLVHRFYYNQLQINGGRNDGFVAWGDSGALVMGRYADTAAHLRLWQLARQYTLCDNFFMGAFGGSFLNHQYLVAAQPPYYPHADQSPARMQTTLLDPDDPRGIQPLLHERTHASAMDGPPKFVRSGGLTPDFWAVDTMMPAYQPCGLSNPADPLLAPAGSPNVLPPQQHAHIGDRLDAAGVDWAWYAGGWALALQGKGDGEGFPPVPNFQYHHQPLNYFAGLAPGSAARARHLRDGGVGPHAPDNRFMADARAGTLPPVAFYKPQGDLNMHAGYSDVAAGDTHIEQVIQALRAGPAWDRTVVVITFDENGGWWDHVAPPRADRWGPGSRIPALVVSPLARRGHVDHTVYDTGSILRLIIRRFGLQTLPGLALREQAMLAASGMAPGDLTAALDLG